MFVIGWYFNEAGWPVYASVKWTIIASDNSLSLDRCLAIFYSNACLLLIWTLGTNINQNSTIVIKGNEFKMLSAKWQPFCLNLNVPDFYKGKPVKYHSVIHLATNNRKM